MRKLFLILLVFLIISFVSALCNETQIDINTANLTELDKITGIGPSKAQAIIDSRPFSSVDDLIRVSGIGNITLSKIKEQGLVCVNEKTKTSNETTKNEEDTSEVTQNNTETNQNSEIIQSSSTENQNRDSKNFKSITLETINLQTGKDIKSKNGRKYLNKSNYAIFGFIAFCILLGILFLIKNIKKSYKSEFD